MKIQENEQEKYSRKSQQLAIYSGCCGALSAIMIQDSAVIILFAGMLGAGNMLSMLTTALFGIMSCLFLLPAAYVAARVGYKRLIIKATYGAALAIILLALSPFLNSWAKYGMIAALVCFSILMTLHISAWFPFLDEFLPKKKRSSFFGMLRFSWQSCCIIFFLICGFIMGESPDLWILQSIIVFTGIALLGQSILYK